MKAVRISDYEWNYLKDDGTYLLNEHVFECWNFSDGLGLIQYNNMSYNFINYNGKKLLKTNADFCWFVFKNMYAEIKINGIWYIIDTECNFYDSNKISFKELYNLYPNMRSELIEIISKYTYHDVDEYFI